VTLQDLGSLGELIAAVATVATLIYLAVQIRQNTRALGHAADRAVLEDANNWRGNLIQNPEVAELYRKGLRDPDALDPIEKLRFRMLLDALFSTWLYMFRTDHHARKSSERYIRDTLARPGGAQYWANEKKSGLDALFVEYVDGLARKDDGDG
jgi:hypothetical protein